VTAPDAFWAEFAARYYRREPVETDAPRQDFAVSKEDLFRLLVRACGDRATGPNPQHVRFHVGQRQVIADLADYLPTTADGTLDGYLARLEHQLGGEPYLLVVEHGHVPSRIVWKQAAGFLAGLYEATGVLPGSVDVEVFVGRYPHTMPGIHQERSGVFVSMVEGTKDILAWPPATSGLPLGSARYEHVTGSARRLRCAPGRLVYWPAMHWHVGESPARPSAGLHIAVLDDALSTTDLLAGPGEPGIDVSAPGTSWSPVALDDMTELDAAVDSVVAAYGDRDVVRERLVAGWLRRRTALGFPAVPPPRRVTLRPGDMLTRDGVHPIVLASRDATTSWLAADGRVGYARSSPSLAALVDGLNSGQPIALAAALELAATAADRDVLLRVLTLLASWRALAATAAPRAAI
jgi:50S ribosomal protein L16 3-hydroxylase